MNVQPWAMYTPQAYQPYPLTGFLGGIAPGTGGGQLAPQSLIGHMFSGLAGFPGQGIAGQFGYPPVGQFGYPPVGQFGYPPVSLFGYPPVGQFGQSPLGHTLGSLGGLLPFHAMSGMLPGLWGGPLAAQFAPQGLFGTPFSQGAGLPGQGIAGQFGYPPVGLLGQPPLGHTFGSLNSPFGYPQVSHTPGHLGSLLPFSAAPGMAPGLWSGQPPYIGGQWPPYGLNPLSGLAGYSGQGISGQPPFPVTPGMAAVA